MALGGRRATIDTGGGFGSLTFSQPTVGVGGADTDGEVWDDGAILKAFDDALSSHTRKPGSLNKESSKYTLSAAHSASTNYHAGRGGGETPGRRGAGIPGPWEPVVPKEGEREIGYPRGMIPPQDAGQRPGYGPPGAYDYPYGPPRPPSALPNVGGEGMWDRHGMPPPPPPPAPPFPGASIHGPAFQSLDGVHDDEMADLLLAWYYSGYYTGRFRAMQELRSGRYRSLHPHPPTGAPPTPLGPNNTYSAAGGEGWMGDRQQAAGYNTGYYPPPSGGGGGQVGQPSPGQLSDRPGMPVPPRSSGSRSNA